MLISAGLQDYKKLALSINSQHVTASERWLSSDTLAETSSCLGVSVSAVVCSAVKSLQADRKVPPGLGLLSDKTQENI